jgi:hypothetical protein
MLAGLIRFCSTSVENTGKDPEKKAYPSQTAVDSFFNYLYYLSQTTESEMFASAIGFPSNGEEEGKQGISGLNGSDSRLSRFS